MSSVPVNRARYDTSSWKGIALKRHRLASDNSDPEYLVHIEHIETQINQHLDKLGTLLREARKLCWDGQLGQEFLVDCQRVLPGGIRETAPSRYVAEI